MSRISTARRRSLSFHASCSIVSSKAKARPSTHSRVSPPTRKPQSGRHVEREVDDRAGVGHPGVRRDPRARGAAARRTRWARGPGSAPAAAPRAARRLRGQRVEHRLVGHPVLVEEAAPPNRATRRARSSCWRASPRRAGHRAAAARRPRPAAHRVRRGSHRLRLRVRRTTGNDARRRIRRREETDNARPSHSL